MNWARLQKGPRWLLGASILPLLGHLKLRNWNKSEFKNPKCQSSKFPQIQTGAVGSSNCLRLSINWQSIQSQSFDELNGMLGEGVMSSPCDDLGRNLEGTCRPRTTPLRLGQLQEIPKSDATARNILAWHQPTSAAQVGFVPASHQNT